MALSFPKSSRRHERLAKIKEGPGMFVYDGSSEIEEHTPTPMKTGKQEPVYDSNGVPLTDDSGRQIYQRPGKVVVDAQGRAVMGGPPKIERKKLDTRVLWGVEFPKGKEVVVDNIDLAIKLRSTYGFKEVEPGAKIEIKEEADLETLEGLLTLKKSALLDLAKDRGIPADAGEKREDIAKAILRAKG